MQNPLETQEDMCYLTTTASEVPILNHGELPEPFIVGGKKSTPNVQIVNMNLWYRYNKVDTFVVAHWYEKIG